MIPGQNGGWLKEANKTKAKVRSQAVSCRKTRFKSLHRSHGERMRGVKENNDAWTKSG